MRVEAIFFCSDSPKQHAVQSSDLTISSIVKHHGIPPHCPASVWPEISSHPFERHRRDDSFGCTSDADQHIDVHFVNGRSDDIFLASGASMLITPLALRPTAIFFIYMSDA
jgi:hypothetical protein